jgi:hypothetical protein
MQLSKHTAFETYSFQNRQLHAAFETYSFQKQTTSPTYDLQTTAI